MTGRGVLAKIYIRQALTVDNYADKMRPLDAAGEVEMNFYLVFEGYWRVPSSGVAPWPGVYCVYVFRSLSSYRLLYIGEASEVEMRIINHKQKSDWKKAARGHRLYFSAAKMPSDTDRRRAAAAMINHHKPPCNDEYTDFFPFSETAITTKGENLNLDEAFTVNKDASSREVHPGSHAAHPC